VVRPSVSPGGFDASSSAVEAAPVETPVKPAVEVAQLPALRPMILTAIDALARDDGWAPLGPVGSQMSKNNPSFDPRNYGFAQLGKLMRKQDYLEVKEVPMVEGSTLAYPVGTPVRYL
jgi:hypothetical protein